MNATLRPHPSIDDFWRLRNFLREVFLLNDHLEHSWHVARLDYWRWHLITNCHVCESLEKGLSFWETSRSEIVAAVNTLGEGEIRLHVHPHYRTAELLDAMLACAEQTLYAQDEQGRHRIYLPVEPDDSLLQETLTQRGYLKREGTSHKWQRDLDAPIPDLQVAHGYIIRSMGTLDEHPARSWASWRAFHSEEPDENCDGDWSWYQNIQFSPLYRRDLDIVAVTPQGEFASFCTIFYDDYTRSAVCVLVGTAVEHWRRGLGKAVIFEGMQRLQRLGCRRVFATAYDSPADALYRSVMQTMRLAETWSKQW